MTELGRMSNGWQNVVRWTSPGWYVYLVFRVVVLFAVMCYYAMVDE